MPSAADPHRLPSTVIPSRYDLVVEPDLEKASFKGSVRIEVEVREPTAEIALNAKELELPEARVAGVGLPGRPGPWRPDVVLDAELDRVLLRLPEPVPPGAYVLELSFRGTLNEKLAGFYRSTFSDEQGEQRTIATTQFESTDARRAFPCFDEPAFKATFAVTLVVPEELFAVSNGPVESIEPAGGGKKRVRFAETMKMSTYLLAFVVGPLEATEPMDVDGVPLRVVHPVGKGHLTAYALEAGAFALRFFSGYYGLAYPGRKLDLVAIPDFAFGAMENLGCVTFREVLLLVDRTQATEPELLRVAEVITHEIAHMWFGDLVTMRWWNGIWLNEAFATFMATLCVDAFKPEWGRWEQFSRERSAAFDVDSLATTRPVEYPVRSPAEADGMFDVLTYQKGASVLRMLERYLGEAKFRDGIREYLRRHAYGNTETRDLWQAIEDVTREPVRRIMDSWIFQPGFPVIEVARGRGAAELTQRRFTYGAGVDGESLWSVPLLLRDARGGEHRLLLEGRSARLEVESDSVLANAGAHGFYRIRYAPELLGRIAQRAGADLKPAERFSLLDDAWASLTAGEGAASEFLCFAQIFSGETDLDVWALLTGCLDALERLLEGAARDRYRELLRALYAPALERFGWEPRRDEEPRNLELRALLVRALGATAREPDTVAAARRLHARYLAEPSGVEPNLASAVAFVVASTGTTEDYQVFVERFRTAATPQEERRYRSLLSVFPERPEMVRTLRMTVDGTIRSQDAPYLLAGCLENRDQGPLVWRFIEENWEKMLRLYPDNAIVRMLSGVRALSKRPAAEAVLAFFETHRVSKGELSLKQHLEKLRVNVAFREREEARFADALLQSGAEAARPLSPAWACPSGRMEG
ncbi:MAG: M1 family metallopeptidase [Deltaproteobacteria bacterium]|nr:M1 family metallopeptidase [Deltaproteobacteria bacterium]